MILTTKEINDIQDIAVMKKENFGDVDKTIAEQIKKYYPEVDEKAIFTAVKTKQIINNIEFRIEDNADELNSIIENGLQKIHTAIEQKQDSDLFIEFCEAIQRAYIRGYISSYLDN